MNLRAPIASHSSLLPRLDPRSIDRCVHRCVRASIDACVHRWHRSMRTCIDAFIVHRCVHRCFHRSSMRASMRSSFIDACIDAFIDRWHRSTPNDPFDPSLQSSSSISIIHATVETRATWTLVVSRDSSNTPDPTTARVWRAPGGGLHPPVVTR